MALQTETRVVRAKRIKRRLPPDLIAGMTGARLALLRTEKMQVTQAQLCKWLGVANSHTLSDWERGIRPVPKPVALAARWLAQLCQK